MKKVYIQTQNSVLYQILKNINSYKTVSVSEDIVSKITKDIEKLKTKGINITIDGNKLFLKKSVDYEVYKR